MKNKKRIFTSFLALTLTVTAFAGCNAKVNKPGSGLGNSSLSENSSAISHVDTGSGTDSSQNNTSGNSGDTQNSQPGSNSNPNPSGSTSFKEPVYDLGGREFVIASENAVPDRNKKNIFNESLTLTEKKYNCKFKFVQKSDYFSLYYSIINDHAAGTASYDAVILRGYDIYPNMASSGAVLELDNYYDFKNDPTWNVDFFKDLGVFKGHRYSIPYTPNEMGDAIWYNRALFRKFNVKDPWEYVNSNQWNWTTFRAICKQLTQDTTGDGKPDYWAFTASDPWLSFIYSNNGNLLTGGISSAPKLALNSVNAIEAIQFIADLHMIDNTIPDGAELGAITDKPFNALFTGKVAMAPYHARYGAVMLAQGIPASDIGWVYYPKGPKATNYITPSGTMPEMFVIPREVSEPKQVTAVMQDLAAYWDTSREIKRKVSDKTDELYEALKSSLDDNAKKVFYYQAQHPVFTLANNYYTYDTLQTKLWPVILNKEKSVKSAVDSMKTAMQEELTTKYAGTAVKK